VRSNREEGYASVILILLMGLVVVGCAAVAFVGAIAAARVRASTAADLSALAAATDGDCAKAEPVARSNRAELTTCALDGQDVIVNVRVPVTLPGRQLYVSALSRAGPA
jgi:secretion/DNA translocation related TadE-like protein